MPDQAPRHAAPNQRLLRLAYAAIGLLIGGAWALGQNTPPWEHTLRLLVVVVVIPPFLHLLRQRVRRIASIQPPLRPMVAAKVLLLAAALGLDVLLARWTEGAELITAAALALTVAIGGPVLHRRLLPGSAGP